MFAFKVFEKNQNIANSLKACSVNCAVLADWLKSVAEIIEYFSDH